MRAANGSPIKSNASNRNVGLCVADMKIVTIPFSCHIVLALVVRKMRSGTINGVSEPPASDERAPCFSC